MTMSCPEVVYQAYYPYLYQRPTTSASSVARTTPFPPFSHQYDRFNVQRSLEATQHQQSTSPLDPVTASAGPPYHGTTTTHHHTTSSHHSSAGSVSSGGGGVGSPGSPLRHKEDEPPPSTGRASGEGPVGPEDDEDDEDDTPGGSSSGRSRAQYMSANCVVFTHYSGDVAAVVDEHFTRALNYVENKGTSSSGHIKDMSPMTARNFPPSFWNSNYQVSAATVTSAHHAAELYAASDPYHPHGATPTTSDPWHSHYQQYSAAAAHHHHRAVHEYHHHHNMAQYGGLLLPPPTRLPPHVTASHQYSKGAMSEPWGSAATHGARLHHDPAAAHHSHTHALDTAGYPAYPTMAGLEAQVQETSKDLYWF